jgi:hypothetical protein
VPGTLRWHSLVDQDNVLITNRRDSGLQRLQGVHGPAFGISTQYEALHNIGCSDLSSFAMLQFLQGNFCKAALLMVLWTCGPPSLPASQRVDLSAGI